MFPGKNWSWDGISSNPNISLQGVLNNSHLPWNWYLLYKNLNLTFQDILDNPHINWVWTQLSVNVFTWNNKKTN